MFKNSIQHNHYDPALAEFCAKLSKIIYTDFETDDGRQTLEDQLSELQIDLSSIRTVRTELNKKKRYDLFKSIENEPAVEAMACHHPESGVNFIAFRGTDSDDIGEWIQNLNADLDSSSTSSKFHSGFWNFHELVEVAVTDWVKSFNGQPIVLCGHSLGGAIAIISMITDKTDAISAVYNFGSPRVGRISDEDISSPVYRVTNAIDPIPELPSRVKGLYKHIGLEMQFQTNNNDPVAKNIDSASAEIKEAAREIWQGLRNRVGQDRGSRKSFIKRKIDAHDIDLYVSNLTTALQRHQIS